MTTVYWFIATLLVSTFLVSDVLADRYRRSDRDLEQFASALNGALRLRYGKRAYDPTLFDRIATFQQVGKRNSDPFYDGFYFPSDQQHKRSTLADRVVASLNGAERLRFG